MRKLCLFLSCAVLLLAGCQTRHRNAPRAAQPSDTLFTARRAMLTYVEDPDLALSIIDSAEVIGNVSPYLADFLRATSTRAPPSIPGSMRASHFAKCCSSRTPPGRTPPGPRTTG
ncbi:MAG: hypothetical protein IJU34_01115 [Bacteroidales bacterium]|nr:hypothetical protein [Bacteroidales bacterium]